MKATLLHHYSEAPLVLDVDRVYDQGDFGNGKPRGLWLSDDSGAPGWREWCESEAWGEDQLDHRTAFMLTPDANVLHLRSLPDLQAFTAEYAGHPALRGTALADEWIDWPRVAGEFDGILITPYQWRARLDFGTRWYYGWDCASGCFWNLRALAVMPDLT